MTIRKYDTDEEADSEILGAIDTVLDVYRSIGATVNEIDRKNSAYTKSSIEKIKYLMTADQSIKGTLVDMLKAYAASPDATREELGILFERHININRQEFLDGKSLYHKSVLSRRVNTQPLEIADGVTLDAAGVQLFLQMKNFYPAARVRDFVASLFREGERTVSSAEIFLKNDADFILLILALIRCGERGMRYKVSFQGGSIVRNGYRIPCLTIERSDKDVV
jgi:hypothetical protein